VAEPAQATAAPVEPVIPERANQQFAQAVALLQAGKLTDAELELKQLILAYPEYPGPYVNLGLLYERAGKYPEAEQALRQATQKGMPSALTYTELGITYRQLGRFKDAESAYGEAIKIDPNYAPAHLNLGVLCDLYLQQPQRALEAFERYMELSGNSDKRVATWIAELKARVGSNPKPQTAEASP
jgi:tetratricopeptide (TPR) repeat protein